MWWQKRGLHPYARPAAPSAELDRIVLKSSTSQRAFANTATCRKAAITTRILQLVHELCTKRIHVTKRDLFYTDVKLFEVRALTCQAAGPGALPRGG